MEFTITKDLKKKLNDLARFCKSEFMIFVDNKILMVADDANSYGFIVNKDFFPFKSMIAAASFLNIINSSEEDLILVLDTKGEDFVIKNKKAKIIFKLSQKDCKGTDFGKYFSIKKLDYYRLTDKSIKSIDNLFDLFNDGMSYLMERAVVIKDGLIYAINVSSAIKTVGISKKVCYRFPYNYFKSIKFSDYSDLKINYGNEISTIQLDKDLFLSFVNLKDNSDMDINKIYGINGQEVNLGHKFGMIFSYLNLFSEKKIICDIQLIDGRVIFSINNIECKLKKIVMAENNFSCKFSVDFKQMSIIRNFFDFDKAIFSLCDDRLLSSFGGFDYVIGRIS